MKSKKLNVLKFIIIIIDVLVLIYGGIILYKWMNKNTNNELNYNSSIDNITENNLDDIENVEERLEKKLANRIENEYKNFKFYLPSDISFTIIDDYKFKLKSDNYKANAEVFLDKDSSIINNNETYYNILLKNNLKVDELKSYVIDDTVVVTYNYHGDKSAILCYFTLFPTYEIELEFYNKDNSFNDDNLKKLINELLYTMYSLSDNKHKYHSFNKDNNKLIGESLVVEQ